jgi:20S proteasome alpha/beta subunit
MTTIAGIETKRGVMIGGDSASVSRIELTVTKTGIRKVFQVGYFLMGCAGSFRMMQLLRYALKVDLQERILMNDEEYLSIVFTIALRKCFEDNAYSDFESNEDGGEFLLGYNGRLYAVYPDFQINRSLDGFGAVGTGAAYALGSLATSEGQKAEARIEQALEAAARFSAGTCPPYAILEAVSEL